MKESHFEKLLHHGQNMKSGRRHSSQVFFVVFSFILFGVIEDRTQPSNDSMLYNSSFRNGSC